MQSQKSDPRGMVALVIRALQRARIAILTVAITHLVAVSVGILMVYTGKGWALTYRDHIVSGAQSNPIAIALKQNERLRAAILDFGGNLYGAIANTLAGLGILAPYSIFAYRRLDRRDRLHR